MSHRDTCYQCKGALYGEIEHDTGLCGHCADRMYEREQNRREWDYYHPDDACPASELEKRR